MNFGEFDQKTVEKSKINTIFKQQVISEPQKLHKIFSSEPWLLIKWLLIKKVYETWLFGRGNPRLNIYLKRINEKKQMFDTPKQSHRCGRNIFFRN